MKNSGTQRRAELSFETTSNSQPLDESIRQVPDERLDPFLRFLARLIARDLRDYPDLPIDKVIIDEPMLDDYASRCTKTSTHQST